MNLRLVLKTYSNLRQLTDDESALLETLRAMNDSERELLVESLSPQSVKKAVKKSAKKPNIPLCVACGYSESSIRHSATAATDDYHPFQSPSTKSKRASGMAATIGSSLQRGRQGQQRTAYCAYVSEDGDDPTQCGESESSGIHDPLMGYRNYHPFQPSASTAARESTPASSGIDGDGVGSVAQGASSGD